MITWFIILLSATLLNVAFFCSHSAGIVIIPALALLVITLMRAPLKRPVSMALLWGGCVFMPHFLWLYALLNNKSTAGTWCALLLYGVVVVYFVGTFVIWFWFTHKIMVVISAQMVRDTSLRSVPHHERAKYLEYCQSEQTLPAYPCEQTLSTCPREQTLPAYPCEQTLPARPEEPHCSFSYNRRLEGFLIILFILISMFTYYQLIETVSLSPFVGYQEGYPFLNPLIPLAPLFTQVQQPSTQHIHYIQPIKSTHNPMIDGQIIFHHLSKQTYGDANIIVAPESFFSFPINMYPQNIALWSCVIPPQAYFVFGTQWKEGNKRYQVICCLHDTKIFFMYRKQHLIAFVECMPPWFKKNSFLRSLFLNNSEECQISSMSLDHIKLNNQTVSLKLCSEFFFIKYNSDTNGVTMVFFLINDHWFVDYFRKIIENLACVKSLWLNVPILYVGHSSCKLISRKGFA